MTAKFSYDRSFKFSYDGYLKRKLREKEEKGSEGVDRSVAVNRGRMKNNGKRVNRPEEGIRGKIGKRGKGVDRSVAGSRGKMKNDGKRVNQSEAGSRGKMKNRGEGVNRSEPGCRTSCCRKTKSRKPNVYKGCGLHRKNRCDWIRTSGLCVPNAALYQTEPRIDC